MSSTDKISLWHLSKSRVNLQTVIRLPCLSKGSPETCFTDPIRILEVMPALYYIPYILK